jgi:hypothetical protein
MLVITPPGMEMSSMPAAERLRTPVLLGLKTASAKGKLKVMVDLAFQSLRVKRPLGKVIGI